MTNDECFVNLHEDCNYSGASACLPGPANLPDLAKLTLGNWDNRATSLTTGDSTWIELYRNTNYKGLDSRDVLCFGPNTTVRDLQDFSTPSGNFRKALSSLKMFDSRPANWPGSATADRRGTVLSNMRRASVNRMVKSATTTIVSVVPVVGDVADVLLSIFWPTANKAQTVADMQAWMSMLLHDVLTDLANKNFEDKIAGLLELLKQYRDDPTPAHFNALESAAKFIQHTFVADTESTDAAYYQSIFGTIALSIYRLAHFCFEETHGAPPTAKQSADTLAYLTDSIRKLRAAVHTSFQTSRDKRLAMVTAVDHKPLMSTHYFEATDAYSGWHTAQFLYSDRYGSGWLKPSEAKAVANDSVTYFRDRCAAPTFDAEFATYLEAADIWTYFDQAATGPLPTTRTTVAMGQWGRPCATTDPRATARHADFDYRVPSGHHLARIRLYGGQYVDGLTVETAPDGADAAVSAGKWGIVEDKKQSVMDMPIRSDQHVVAAFGAWGAKVDHVSFRLKWTGGPGIPTESGLGHSTGGDPFACAGPDGSDAVLTGFFGQTDGKNCLVSLGFYWSYDRIKPRDS